jgi:hypothetical protein
MAQTLPTTSATKPTKAVWAGILSGLFAFLNSISSALQGEHSGWGTITAGQWVTAAVGTLAAFGATGGVTYAVRNRPVG